MCYLYEHLQYSPLNLTITNKTATNEMSRWRFFKFHFLNILCNAKFYVALIVVKENFVSHTMDISFVKKNLNLLRELLLFVVVIIVYWGRFYLNISMFICWID